MSESKIFPPYPIIVMIILVGFLLAGLILHETNIAAKHSNKDKVLVEYDVTDVNGCKFRIKVYEFTTETISLDNCNKNK